MRKLKVAILVSTNNSKQVKTFLESKKNLEQLFDIDFYFSYYGEDSEIFDELSQFQFKFLQKRKIFKLVFYNQIVNDHKIADLYDGFIFPDDDIVISAEDLSLFITQSFKLNLDYAQPSLDSNSETYWKHLYHKKNTEFQRTNFIEIQFYFLSARLLKLSLPFLSKGKTGFGYDYALSLLATRDLKNPPVVFHNIQMHHPYRPLVNSVVRKTNELSEFNQNYLNEIASSFNFQNGVSLCRRYTPMIIYTKGSVYSKITSVILTNIIRRFVPIKRIIRKFKLYELKNLFRYYRYDKNFSPVKTFLLLCRWIIDLNSRYLFSSINKSPLFMYDLTLFLQNNLKHNHKVFLDVPKKSAIFVASLVQETVNPLNESYLVKMPNDDNKIFKDETQEFDFAILEGKERLKYLRHSIPKIKQGGFLILVDSHLYEFQEASELIPSNWTLTELVSPAPSSIHPLFKKVKIWQKRS